MNAQLPPPFFLYGEPPRAADPDFLHVEDLAVRSRPSGWRIATHRHADLNHLILITEGGGATLYEGQEQSFTAPSLLVVPAGTVHGFSWARGTQGRVLTIATVQLEQVLSLWPEGAPLFAAPRAVALEPAESAELASTVAQIARECTWHALGQTAAVQALLQLALVRAARAAERSGAASEASGRQVRLVARFRQLVEERYRQREPVAAYARALGVSETALRDACAAQGLSPTQIRDERAVLEAQRLLAFSAVSVAEIGASIGLADPAYFSRFFRRLCGVSPGQWRARLARRKPG
ncbi:helix-turn-helix domain-containing protein [Aurantiacibacter xanthus]|uniref:Helix-turn-helix domain-containing protein n=1 Tax=Aurantiacibacter xanthus TaxID=1784712 RepID=A0A3A1P624_9SPHN|nr:helix-turn-helix domain-containing protein [Aurantiacibacter xanthus]RIV83022.1 helix-turn-helix domain-containing protein [Aurantiacibacter xanthus]